MRVRRAFTLIELLVVMAIIGILVGISLPGLRMIQREAKNATCTANLRQTFVGMEAYTQSNRDTLPMCEFLPVATVHGPQGGLPNLLSGYIPRDSDVWRCPADEDPDSLETGTSYIYSPGLLRYTPAVQAEVATLLLSFQPGSMSLAQLDRSRLDAEGRLMTSFFRANPTKYPLLADSQDRHKRSNSQRNGVFLDGSVRAADPPPQEQISLPGGDVVDPGNPTNPTGP